MTTRDVDPQDGGELWVEQPEGHEPCPAALYLDTKMSDAAVRFWLVLRDCAKRPRPGKKPGEMPNRKELGEILGMSVRSIDPRMAALEEHGWLLIQPQWNADGPGQAKNRYLLMWRPISGEDDPRLVDHRARVAAFEAEMAARMATNAAKRAAEKAEESAENARSTRPRSVRKTAAQKGVQKTARGHGETTEPDTPVQDPARGPLQSSARGPVQKAAPQKTHLPKPTSGTTEVPTSETAVDPAVGAERTVGGSGAARPAASGRKPPAARKEKSSTRRRPARGVGQVVAVLPAEVRLRMGERVPDRLVARITAALDTRTVAQMRDRVDRRWVLGGFSQAVDSGRFDAVAVATALIRPGRCPDVRCEDGSVRVDEHHVKPCGQCGTDGQPPAWAVAPDGWDGTASTEQRLAPQPGTGPGPVAGVCELQDDGYGTCIACELPIGHPRHQRLAVPA